MDEIVLKKALPVVFEERRSLINSDVWLKELSFKKGETVLIEAKEVADGDKVSATTTVPTKANYTFKYWSLTKTNQEEYDFNTPVLEDLILYAKNMTTAATAAATHPTTPYCIPRRMISDKRMIILL